MATLTISGRSDVGAVAADIDGVAASVRDLGDDVSRVDDVARASGTGLDTLAAAGDNVASRSSQAAGALGDLGGGLEAVGLTGAGAALEGVGLAAQTAAGAGDALNLVADTTVGKFIAQTAATVAHTTATAAQTVATTAGTVATGAFNAVMSLNPVALVVISVLALAAAVVLAYKNSETFREIVQGVFEAAKTYVGFYVDAIETVIDIVQSLPGVAKDAWEKVSGAVGDAVDTAVDKVDDLVSAVIDGPRDAASTVAGYFSAMFAPILDAIGWVDDLIAKIGGIDFPDLNPLNRAVIPGTGVRPDGGPGDTADPFPGGSVVISLTAAPQDKEKSMSDLLDALREYFARRGQVLSITEVPQ